MGLLVGDGTITEDRAELSVWARPAVGNSDIDVGGPHSVMAAALDAARCFNHRADFSGWHQGARPRRVPPRHGRHHRARARSGPAAGPPDRHARPSNAARASSIAASCAACSTPMAACRARRLKGVSVRLAQLGPRLLEGAQRMLLRLGIASSMYRNRAQHELVITGENVARFAELVGFADTVKRARLARLLGGYKRTLNRERFVATVESVRSRRHGRRVRRADSRASTSSMPTASTRTTAASSRCRRMARACWARSISRAS